MAYYRPSRQVHKRITWKQIANYHWMNRDCTMVMEHGDVRDSFYGCPLYQVAWHLLRFEASGTTKVVRLTFQYGPERVYDVDLTSADYVLIKGGYQKFAANVVPK